MRLKAHTVTKVEEAGEHMLVHIGRLGKRLLRCTPRRVECPRCGVRVEDRLRPPVHMIGIDEVSRRQGQAYLTVVYNLERRVLLWVGDDRTEEASGRSSPKKWGYPEQPGKGPGKRNKEPAGVTAPAGRSRRRAWES